MQDLFRTIASALKSSDENGELDFSFVEAAWQRSVGENLSIHAIPIRLDKTRLIVAVDNETWLKQLTALSSELLFKLNAQAGRRIVAFLDFVIDPETVNSVRDDRSDSFKTNAFVEDYKLDAEIISASDSIGEDSLRSQFLRAARANLSRDKRT